MPYKVHTVLTDNGTHFTDPRGAAWSPAEIRQMIKLKEPFRAHAFEYACALTDIDHRLTKPKHPWTNGQSLPHPGADRKHTNAAAAASLHQIPRSFISIFAR